MGRIGGRITRRTRRLVVKDVGDEVVVYDLDTDKVHLLDHRATAIWRALDDGPRAIEACVDPTDAEQSLAVIDELRDAQLIELETAAPLLDRRRVLKLAGAAALSAPAIMTILAPTPAAASSALTACGASGPCPGTPALCSNGTCGTDNLCCSCVGNQTTTCGGAANANVTNRCCTGNACTNVGTTGFRCCQPTGGVVGSGTCCATNSGGTCVATPAGSSPGVADTAMCQTYTNRTINISSGRCCIASGGATSANLGATQCCSGTLATPSSTAIAVGSGANSNTITSAAVGALAAGTNLVIAWTADSLASTAYSAFSSLSTTNGGTLTVVNSSTTASGGASGTAASGLIAGVVLATVVSGFTASSTISVNLSGGTNPAKTQMHVRSVTNVAFDDFVSFTGAGTAGSATANATPTGTGDLVFGLGAAESKAADTTLGGSWTATQSTVSGTTGTANTQIALITEVITATTAGAAVSNVRANGSDDAVAIGIALKRTCT